MRQNLSVEQVLSLSPEAQQRLREWWKPQVGDWYQADNYTAYHGAILLGVSGEGMLWCEWDNDGCSDGHTAKAACLPLLSIGQCLQLLAEHGVFVNLAGPYTELADGKYELQYGSGNMANRDEWTTEPIDALYAAVKAVLEVGE